MLVKGTLLFVEMALDALARNFGFACIFFPLFWLENYFAVECFALSITGVIVNDFLDELLYSLSPSRFVL